MPKIREPVFGTPKRAAISFLKVDAIMRDSRLASELIRFEPNGSSGCADRGSSRIDEESRSLPNSPAAISR